MKRTRTSKIILAAAAIFAALFLIATYGMSLPTLPFAPIDFNGPVAADSNGDITAVVDNESRRMLILDSDGTITGIVDCDTFDIPIETITDVCVSGDTVYVAGLRYKAGSDIVNDERIVAFDANGNITGIQLEMENELFGTVAIRSLCDAPGGVIAVMETTTSADSADSEDFFRAYASFVFVNSDDCQEVDSIDLGDFELYDAGYSPKSKAKAILNVRGLIDCGDSDDVALYPNHAFTSIDVGDSGLLYACDDASGSVCSFDSKGEVSEVIEGEGYDRIHTNGNVIALCSQGQNLVVLSDLQGNNLTTIQSALPCLRLSLHVLLVWACALFLVGLVLVYAFRSLRARLAAGETKGLGPMLASIAVVVAVGAAVGGFMNSSYQSSLQTRCHEIDMCADYLATQIFDLAETMEKIDSREHIRSDDGDPNEAFSDIIDVVSPAAGLAYAANENSISMYFVVYGKDDQGIYHIADSSQDHVLGSSAENAPNIQAIQQAFDVTEYSLEMHTGRTVHDSTIYRLVPIAYPEMDRTLGVIEIGSKVRSFDALTKSDLAQRALALLVLVLVVYLTYSELRACGRCMLYHRELQKKNSRDAIAALTRPFTFFVTLLSSVDAVMTVLIARDLLEASELGSSSSLIALPAVMLGLGLVAGQITYGFIGGRIGLRRLIVGGAIAMMLCAAFTVFAVRSDYFWAYCVAKLAMAVPFGMLYTLGYSLPRLAESDQARAAASHDVRRTDTSAAALGTVLGGYAAQVLGNAWVYVIVAIACFPVLIMGLNLISKKEGAPEAKEHKASNRKSVLLFMRSRPALSLALLILLPATIAAGYTSILFPLFSADFGLTKAHINNIFVLGQLVVYVSIRFIGRAEQAYGKWRLSTTAVALLGVVFLLFALNTTIVWSIVVIVIIAVLGKTSDGWKGLWLKSAEHADVPTGPATSAMFAARSLALIAQPFILGLLIGVADSVAVIVIGAICLVCAGLFFLLTRHSSLSSNEVSASDALEVVDGSDAGADVR